MATANISFTLLIDSVCVIDRTTRYS